jgi:hypothetical protein
VFYSSTRCVQLCLALISAPSDTLIFDSAISDMCVEPIAIYEVMVMVMVMVIVLERSF